MPATFSRASARVATFLLLTIVTIVAITSLSLASANGPYNVQSGDTLYGIAGKMGVSDGSLSDWVDEVVTINRLASPDSLKVGQQLTLPASSSPSPSSGPSSSSSARSSSASYTVKGGDTLYDIAARNGVSETVLPSWIDSVLKLNNLGSGDNIREGDELKLPAQPLTSGSSGSSRSSSATGTTSTTRYTVQAGDTLYDVAARNSVPDASLSSWIDSVLKLNGLSSADSIRQGDELTLPARPSASRASATSTSGAAKPAATTQYTVQAGDTLYDIAGKNGVPDSELPAWIDSVLKLNNLRSPDLLALGDALKVPAKAGGASGSPTGNTSTPKSTATINYVVKSGDTLYDIGLKNGAADAAIASWVSTTLSLNDLASPDVLREGDSLKLPVPQTGNSGESNAGQGADPSLFVSTGNITYNVQKGDTWPGIARKLNVPQGQMASWIDQAMALSNLNKDEKLVEGIVLLVPAPGSAATDQSPVEPTKPASKSSQSKATTEYTVQSGDTLSDIAAKFKIGFGQLSGWMRDVLELSELSSPDMLRAGQTLIVPGELPSPSATAATKQTSSPAQVTPNSRSVASTPALAPQATPPGLLRGPNNTCFYTVIAGDTWDSISQKLGVAADSKQAWIDGIRALNNIKDNSLPVGDALRLLC